MAESRETVDQDQDDGDEPEVLAPDEMSESATPAASTASNTATVQQQPMPSYSRQNRNMMEKHRRDKMNAHISNLALLVPTVANSPKKLDKTSILRLTAAFLRLHKFLMAEPGNVRKFGLPDFLKGCNLSQAFMDVMDGFMIIVSSNGNILFVSHSVEAMLGHPQNSLMGQKLHSITCREDHDELNRNLAPDPDPNSEQEGGSGQLSLTEDSSSNSGDGSSSSSQSTPSPRLHTPALTGADAPEALSQRRSFYLRLSQRAVSRSEITQYELFHVLGHLRVPQKPSPGPSAHSRTRNRQRESSTTGTATENDSVLIAVVRAVRENSIAARSLLEPSKDEYVTRHYIDGRIIYSDHRISVVAGYMAEEVAGESAFRFMHREDVRFTIVALREMYDRGKESYGSSCYRLLSKTGQYIYLRTHGYLEYDKDTHQIVSFICINTLVSEEEGEELVQQMKARYSSTITSSRQQPALLPPTPGPSTSSGSGGGGGSISNLESNQLEVDISQLVQHVPEATEDSKAPSPLPDAQYEKAVRYSQVLPSPTEQAARVGIKPSSRVGPVSPTGPLTVTIPESTQRGHSEGSWTTIKRESVITSLVPGMKMETRRHETVLVSTQQSQAENSGDRRMKRTSSAAESEAHIALKRQHVSYNRRRERRATEPTNQVQPNSPILEEPRRTPDEQFGLIMNRNSSVTSPLTNSPLHCIGRGYSEPGAPNPISPTQSGEFVTPDFQPKSGNFTLLTLVHSPSPVSPLQPMVCVPPNIMAGTPSPGPQSPSRSSSSILEFSPAQLPLSHSPSATQMASFSVGVGHGSPLDSFAASSLHSPTQYTSLSAFGEATSMLSPGDSYSSLATLESDLADLFPCNTMLPHSGLFDDMVIPEQQAVSEQSPLVTMDQRLLQTHRELGTSLQIQRRDINIIEDNIHQLPLSSVVSERLRPQISQIKAQQKEHEQELRTLRQDHHNIHCSSRTVCRMNQDIGV